MSPPNIAPLSTAFRPFTPTAPPVDELTLSQPGPNGSQLTVGGTASASGESNAKAWDACAGCRRTGDGMICGAEDEVADGLRGAAMAAAFEATDSKDGDTNGPLSKVQ